MKRYFIILLLTLLDFNSLNSNIIEFDNIITSVEKSYSEVRDYTCEFSKKEYIDGEYFEDKNVLYKYKKSNNYYLKFTSGSLEDAEVIYAGKKYNYQMRIHLGGFWSFIDLELDPKGSMAMKGNRHSILESDMGYIIKLIKDNYLKAKENNEGSIKFVKETLIDEKIAKLYLAEFPDNQKYYAHKIYIYLDVTHNLPVKFSIYNWDDMLIEKYVINNLKLNVGLTDKDFDVENPKYDF